MARIVTQNDIIVHLTPEQLSRIPVLHEMCTLMPASNPDEAMPLLDVNSETLLSLISLPDEPRCLIPTDRLIYAIHVADFLGMEPALEILYNHLQVVISTMDIPEIATFLSGRESST